MSKSNPAVKQCQLKRHLLQHHVAIVNNDVNEKNVTDPALWVNHAARFMVDTRISVINEDRTFFAELSVTYVNGTDCRTVLLSAVSVKQSSAGAGDDQTGDYLVEKIGNAWGVRKKSTGEVVFENIPSRSKAYDELDQYLKMLSS